MKTLFVLLCASLVGFTNSQVVSQSPIIDGSLNSDWTSGSLLTSNAVNQWNLQWTNTTLFVGTWMLLPQNYNTTIHDLEVRLFFDTTLMRPKYNSTIVTTTNHGLSSFATKPFPPPVLCDILITCAASLQDGFPVNGSCLVHKSSEFVWVGEGFDASRLFYQRGSNVTFEIGIQISLLNATSKSIYFLADSVLVNKSTRIVAEFIGAAPDSSSDYYGFPLVASPTESSASYPPANSPCYLSHYVAITKQSESLLDWNNASNWLSGWAPDSGALDTTAIIESPINIGFGLNVTVACLMVRKNLITLGGNLHINNKLGQTSQSYFWNSSPTTLSIVGSGSVTFSAPSSIQLYSPLILNSTKAYFISNNGNYYDNNNTIHFSSLTSSNNSFMCGPSSGINLVGPVKLTASSVPFVYLNEGVGLPPSLEISKGNSSTSLLPSGVEWDPTFGQTSPSTVNVASMKYHMLVKTSLENSNISVNVDSESQLAFIADGHCDASFEKCSVLLWNINNRSPVLIQGVKLSISGITFPSNIHCTDDAFIWKQSVTFMSTFNYTIADTNNTRVSSIVEGITNENFTFHYGSEDQASVTVTAADYSSIILTKLNFDLNGKPESESIIASNTTTFSFGANTTGSFRVKYYNLDGCLSWIVVNVDVESVFDSTPSAAPNSESKSGSEKSSFIGALVGAIAGTVVIAALIAVLFIFLIKRRRKNDVPPSTPKHKDMDYAAAMELKTAETGQSRNSKQNYSKGMEWDIRYSEIVVGSELGRGAFGVVYKCRWRNTDCVVKQLDIKKNDEHSIQQFLKEANNVRNLRSHPNVCTIFGVCTDPQYPICIVMEYLPEGSLDNLVYQDQSSEFKIDLESFFDFAKDIASGMSHLHAENILHCDLACRNLLLTAKPSSKGNNKWGVKIADFGLSRITADEYSASNDATFPVRWSSPETLSSNRISRASDVFSFGVVLWEIAEGKRPWIGLSNQAVVEAVVNRGERLMAPSRLRLPGDVWNLIMQCWKTNPSERPSFNQIYEHLLQLEHNVKQVEQPPNNITSEVKPNGSNSNANNYGVSLQKLTDNVSVESTESTGQTASIHLPDPIPQQHNNNNSNDELYLNQQQQEEYFTKLGSKK